MKIGILALQGAFAEHGHMLDQLGVQHFEIRQKKDLESSFDGLILPGGESTVMGKLLSESGMMDLMREKITAGLPVFGTCAGLILLAEEVEGQPSYLGTMDICVKRNAYGRQLGSFYAQQEVEGIGTVPASFIRAPYVTRAGQKVRVLACTDGKITAVRQGSQLAAAFHPEVTEDVRVHRYFLDLIGHFPN